MTQKKFFINNQKMKSEILFRPALEEEKKMIIKFQRLMAEETEQLALDLQKIEQGVSAVFDQPSRGKYYVATHKSEVIACLLTTYEWSDWRNAMVWWLQSVYVLPEYRRQGIFRLMYAKIKEQVMQMPQVSGIRLYMHHSNHRAAKVYNAVGMDGKNYKMFEWIKPDLPY
jgi:ribosomal protein S18 acetylase RimI-like enzyme